MSVMDQFVLADRVAVVTGGSRGLGRVFALALAEAGARVVVANRNPQDGLSIAQECSGRGMTMISIPTDVTKADQVSALVSKTVERFGRIDILVNNAGITKHVAAKDMALCDWREVLDVNLTGAFVCAQAAGREMIRQGKGSIINIASISGFIVNTPQPQSAYNVSKAGLVMLTKSLATEWAMLGVRVNALAPGYMNTPMSSDYFNDPEVGGVWLRLTPMRRPGEPNELSGALLYLASDASSFTTGQSFIVDGGYVLW